MSYEVLARKWRPLTFNEVVGQDHVTLTLRKAVETDRLSHAYMLSGPRGCGKTSTARILARVINCEATKDGNPCNKCASCISVIAGSNLDVLEIDGASHTGVSEVRDLQESIGYTPSQFKSKVYIIDEVHMLSTHAFNALLKTLEEPPKHVYFIFATTAPNKIPDTIKSRCQRHHFKRLEIREIAGQLEAICKAEKVDYDDDGLRLLARKADGSMRDGTSLLDQCITSSGSNVTAEAVRGILGLIDQEKVTAYIGAIAGGDPSQVLRMLDASINEGLDIQELCGALLEGYRDLMLLATPGDLRDLLFMSNDEVENLKVHLDGYELGDLVVIVERLCNTAPRLRATVDPRILLESLLVDLSLLERQTDIRELLSRLDGPPDRGVSPSAGQTRRSRPRVSESAPDSSATRPSAPSAGVAKVGTAGSLGENPARPQASPVQAQAAKGDVDLDEAKLRELWSGFVTFVRQKKVSLGVCLISGKIYSFDGKHLTLRFQKNFSLQREQVANPKNIDFLQTTFARYFGREVELNCFAEGDERTIAFEEAARRQKAPTERLGSVSEENKPVVKRIMKEFDGEIIRR